MPIEGLFPVLVLMPLPTWRRADCLRKIKSPAQAGKWFKSSAAASASLLTPRLPICILGPCFRLRLPDPIGITATIVTPLLVGARLAKNLPTVAAHFPSYPFARERKHVCCELIIVGTIERRPGTTRAVKPKYEPYIAHFPGHFLYQQVCRFRFPVRAQAPHLHHLLCHYLFDLIA